MNARIASLVLVLAVSCQPALAADKRPDIWDIPLGAAVGDLPVGFVDFACGTNGGPPSRKLTGFADFATCRPEKSGLHEVYFRYDDTAEYIARALEQANDAKRFGGTTAYDFPVTVSLLIDDAGLVQGKRIISDARPANATDRPRVEFWTLGNLLRNGFAGDWTCVKHDLDAGEQPVGTYFIKQDCTLSAPDSTLSIAQSYLQKRGQSFIDPLTQHYRSNDFESLTHFEQLAVGVAANPG